MDELSDVLGRHRPGPFCGTLDVGCEVFIISFAIFCSFFALSRRYRSYARRFDSATSSFEYFLVCFVVCLAAVPACAAVDDCDVTLPSGAPTETATLFPDTFEAFVEDGDDEDTDEGDAEEAIVAMEDVDPVFLLPIDEIENDEILLVTSSTFGRVAFLAFETLVTDVNEDEIEVDEDVEVEVVVAVVVAAVAAAAVAAFFVVIISCRRNSSILYCSYSDIAVIVWSVILCCCFPMVSSPGVGRKGVLLIVPTIPPFHPFPFLPW